MSLSRRQLKMLELAAHGLRYKQIATYLGLSRRTVEHHFGDMRDRTGTKTISELLVWAVRAGLVQPEREDMLPGGRGAEADPSPRKRQWDGKRRPIQLQQGVDNGTTGVRGASVTSTPENISRAQRRRFSEFVEGGGTAGQTLRSVPAGNQADALSTRDVLGALRQIPNERSGLDHTERALIDSARRQGVTWAEIGRALGLRSAQAAQQRRKRLN